MKSHLTIDKTLIDKLLKEILNDVLRCVYPFLTNCLNEKIVRTSLSLMGPILNIKSSLLKSQKLEK